MEGRLLAFLFIAVVTSRGAGLRRMRAQLIDRVFFAKAEGGFPDIRHMPVWRHHLSTEIESISFDRDGRAISMFVRSCSAWHSYPRSRELRAVHHRVVIKSRSRGVSSIITDLPLSFYCTPLASSLSICALGTLNLPRDEAPKAESGVISSSLNNTPL